jgi:hypothetical protein
MFDDEFTDQWAQIVALRDGTSVDLVPTSSLPAGNGVAAAPRGALATYTLDAGEFIQWQDSGEMSGSTLLASQPIAFYGGESPLLRDSSQPECENGASDNAHQQIPPIRALGSEYVGAPFRSRIAIPESVPYRFVGLVDGTTLSYDPPQPSAPVSLDEGAVADFEAISGGEFTLNGMRNRDLQPHFFPTPAPTATKRRRRSAWVSRRLRLLRAHGQLRKVPGTHRYLVTKTGRRVLTAVLTALRTTVRQLTPAA